MSTNVGKPPSRFDFGVEMVCHGMEEVSLGWENPIRRVDFRDSKYRTSDDVTLNSESQSIIPLFTKLRGFRGHCTLMIDESITKLLQNAAESFNVDTRNRGVKTAQRITTKLLAHLIFSRSAQYQLDSTYTPRKTRQNGTHPNK